MSVHENTLNDYWNSIPRMERLARRFGVLTMTSLGIAFLAWPFSLLIAIPAAILFTSFVVCWLFTYFRVDHLREIQRYR